MSRIAINGFGRIGRSILRIIVEQQSDLEVVAINDLGDYKNLAYLLKHDSVMGILNENVSVDGDIMKVGDRSIKLISVKDPADLPWNDLDIDVVKSTLSGLVDGLATMGIENRKIKLIIWFDNGWGYSARIIDTIKKLSQEL
jgi:glyceraldehyde-3-phosphate dehydrogenase/erythrose-4-phosphate dehydrogenase